MWDIIEQSMQSPIHGWSMGSFGAIGEFIWEAREPHSFVTGDKIGCITERGGLAVMIRGDVQPVAYETLTKDPRNWTQAIAFCLPKEKSVMNNFSVVTARGPDYGALKPEHREHQLFDMGLQQGFVDVAIRTDDPTLIAVLNKACGSDLLQPGNPAMAAIIQAGPHRVFTTALGRLEVYQPIGIEKSPEGPHTHVLPKLLASHRAFSANVPIPDGLLPMLTLHAANPCRDLSGREKPFDLQQHLVFQHWLRRFGVAGFYQHKQQIIHALDTHASVDTVNAGDTRLLRTATRVALRQYARLHPEKRAMLKALQL